MPLFCSLLSPLSSLLSPLSSLLSSPRYGSIFRCIGPTLVIAASLAFRSPFFSPFDKRAEADAVKKAFDPLSDHMTLLMAYDGWQKSREEGRGAEREYLHDNFLSRNTLGMIEKMKRQFEKILSDEGFFHRKFRERYNENQTNYELIKAVLVAGLYPNVVKVDAPVSKPKKSGGRGGGRGGGGAPKLKTRKLWEPNSSEEMVSLHPSSVLYGRSGGYGTPFLVFHEKVKTSQVYVRDATAVSPFALLLFGGAVEVAHLKGTHTNCLASCFFFFIFLTFSSFLLFFLSLCLLILLFDSAVAPVWHTVTNQGNARWTIGCGFRFQHSTRCSLWRCGVN
jgi:HrpA-like RNA helicase